MQLAIAAIIGSFLLIGLLAARQRAPDVAQNMSFFVTSTGRGFGGNFGGLRGADAHCQQLAAAAGVSQRTWRAYLSAPATGDAPAVHARDRIGRGPAARTAARGTGDQPEAQPDTDGGARGWFNARGVRVAAGVAELHDGPNELGATHTLTEKGTPVAPGRHDILTGSNPDGTLAGDGSRDTTCRGWTSHDAGRAMLGHHNRSGGGERPTSWNSAHLSRGCSQRALRASLGDGLFYCFAID